MYSTALRRLAAGEERDIWYVDQRNLSACAGNHHNPVRIIDFLRRVLVRRLVVHSRGPRGALIYVRTCLEATCSSLFLPLARATSTQETTQLSANQHILQAHLLNLTYMKVRGSRTLNTVSGATTRMWKQDQNQGTVNDPSVLGTSSGTTGACDSRAHVSGGLNQSKRRPL